MNIFDEYTQQLLNALNSNKVKYLVVGGYAVNYYGYIRTTGDIDLWLEPSKGNQLNIATALKEINIEDNAIQEFLSLDFTQPVSFSDGEEPNRMDFMNFITGIKFTEAWEKRIEVVIDGINLFFIHFDHLILSKINTNRLQDKLDVEELQKIKKSEKKK